MSRLEELRRLASAEPGIDGLGTGTAFALHRLCRVVARLTSAAGSAVSLMSDAGPSGALAASDHNTLSIAELQFTLGEGPCWDVFDRNEAVFASDLGRPAPGTWLAWIAAVSAHSINAAFAFPLLVGPAQVGVLDIYRAIPGKLAESELADVLGLAQIATEILLDGQAAAGEGSTPSGVDSALQSRFTLHQAQGMVMIQLGTPLADAMSRLRAYAYTNDRSLSEVARDIVDRTLTLERDNA